VRLSFILILLLLSGCSTVPPSYQEWPQTAGGFIIPCSELELIAPGTDTDERKLSEIAIIVTTNYAKYHECAAKVSAWISWYTEQKRIYTEQQHEK
jgi:hypothetical protein